MCGVFFEGSGGNEILLFLKIQASLQYPHAPKYHAYITTAVIFNLSFFFCSSNATLLSEGANTR